MDLNLRGYTMDEFRAEWSRMTERDKDRLKWFIIQMEHKPDSKPKEVESVYFIEYQGLIKIGRSSHIRDRMLVLRREVGGELTLLGRIPTKDIKEVTVHKRFAHLRQHGEWFTDCEEIRNYIAEHAEQNTQQPAPARPRRKA